VGAGIVTLCALAPEDATPNSALAMPRLNSHEAGSISDCVEGRSRSAAASNEMQAASGFRGAPPSAIVYAVPEFIWEIWII
jgi:hypothetical protein